MKLQIVAAGYALWLFGIELVFYLVNGENEDALQLAVMAGIAPAVLQLIVTGIEPRGLVAPVKMALLFMLVIPLSYFGNTVDWIPVIYTVNTAFIFTVAILVAGSPDRRLLRSLASIFGVVTAVFLIYVNLTGEYVWGRLTAHGIEPNSWGSVGLAVALSAFAMRRTPFAILNLAVGCMTIYNASARGSLTGFAAGMLVLGILALTRLRSRRLATAIGILGVLLIGVMIMLPDLLTAVSHAADNLLKLDDPERGLGSGFTGRTAGWAETVEIWLRAPLLGVGFRQHETLLTTISSAHNAYLAMLADTGILGLLLYLALLAWSFCAALPIGDQRTRRLVLSTAAAYAVYGLFERRAINSGNPFSLIFLMCCFFSLADQQLRRATLWLPSTLSGIAAARESLATAGDRARLEG